MKSDKSMAVRRLCALICILMIAALLPIRSFAANDGDQIVRVAYELEPGYQEGKEGEYKTGYGYEYLQKLAEMNGWKYEYVYGSFNELLGMLKNGEVDLMGQLSYSEERAEKIFYSSNELSVLGS